MIGHTSHGDLTSARSLVGVASVSDDVVIVIGGSTGGIGIAANQSSSLPTVEIAHITFKHTIYL